MLCVRLPVAAYVVASLLALIAHSTALSAQEKKAKPQVLFTNVNIFDGKSDKLAEGMSVLVEGNLIKKVAKGDIDVDDDATVIDGGGRTLMPGLIDGHVHMQLVVPAPELEFHSAQEIGARMVPVAEDMLMRGFTLVRDLCGNSHGLRNAINAGVVPGPRIASAGACISGWSGHGDFMPSTAQPGQSHTEGLMGTTRFVSGPDEMRQAIREEMRKGASFIKLMIGGGLASLWDPLDATIMSPEEIRAAVEETARWGTYATAHLYTDDSINMAMDAGMRTVEHSHLASRETYERFKKEGVMLNAQVAVTDILVGNPAFTTPASQAKAKYLAENAATSFGYIKELDLPVGFGVDSYGDLDAFRFNSEAIKIRKKYFTDKEILRQIYKNNMVFFDMMGKRLPYRDGPLGEISEGAYADIILVEGDPTEDVSILADWQNKIDLVMKDGKIYKNTLD